MISSILHFTYCHYLIRRSSGRNAQNNFKKSERFPLVGGLKMQFDDVFVV